MSTEIKNTLRQDSEIEHSQNITWQFTPKLSYTYLYS